MEETEKQTPAQKPAEPVVPEDRYVAMNKQPECIIDTTTNKIVAQETFPILAKILSGIEELKKEKK